MTSTLASAIAALKAGKPVLLIDDPSRENEADLILAAESLNEEALRFMLHHSCGIVCLAMRQEKAKALGLKLLLDKSHNTNQQKTPFAMSFEAREGVTTGISVRDRWTTLRAASQAHATHEHIVSPGHVFPLIAEDQGVLARRGHTEGSVDLMMLAGLAPLAVICELINPDETVAKGEQVTAFAKAHDIPIISIAELVTHRLRTENLILEEVATELTLADHGRFGITVFKDCLHEREHVVLEKHAFDQKMPVLVRVHSSCATGDIFHSLHCDCYEQLQYSLKRISEEGGVLIYLDQEGRGIGLFNKIKAYALQTQNMDTVEANEALGFAADEREYYLAANVLRNREIHRVRLLTNNPDKAAQLSQDPYFESVEREAMPVFTNEHNQKYLQTKKEKLNHQL